MSNKSEAADALGERIKKYEEAGRSMPFLMDRLSHIVRCDGICFHTFTKGLKRPFDERLHALMCEVTKDLMQETNAVIGYTQSDEISLILPPNEEGTEIYCGGRVFKVLTRISGRACNTFNRLLPQYLPTKTPGFAQLDARVFPVPTKAEAVNAVLWRELDASKNSVSMAARSMFSHSELQNKNGAQMQEMMFKQHGVNWNDYPAAFKRGSYFQRRKVARRYTTEEMDKLPAKHNARTNPELMVERTDILPLEIPQLTKIANPVDVLFNGAAPIAKA
jgi:tRNA(His) 5'-end guanylyltransferase